MVPPTRIQPGLWYLLPAPVFPERLSGYLRGTHRGRISPVEYYGAKCGLSSALSASYAAVPKSGLEAHMAKQGMRVMDSDLHVVEPRNLWDDYLDPKFRGRI